MLSHVTSNLSATDINVGQLFLQAFIEGLAVAAHAAWQIMVDNPWVLLLFLGMFLLGFVPRRVGCRRRSS